MSKWFIVVAVITNVAKLLMVLDALLGKTSNKLCSD